MKILRIFDIIPTEMIQSLTGIVGNSGCIFVACGYHDSKLQPLNIYVC